MNRVVRLIVPCVLAAALTGCGQRDARHYELALRYKESGNYEQAIAELQTALRVNPRFSKAYNQLGVCYGKVGLYDKAADQFRRAVELDPSLATGHYNLGILYQSHLERPADAVIAYRRYLDLSPGGPRAEAVARIVQGLLERPEVRTAIEESPEEQEQAARAFEEQGDHARAVELYERIAAKGGAGAGRAQLAAARICETELERPGDALRHYQAYLDAHINAPDAADAMAAVERLRQKTSGTPPPADDSGAVAEAERLIKEGQWAKAIELLSGRRDASPDDERVHDLLAEAYLRSGDLQGAEKEYEWLKARQPDFAYAKDLSGIYAALGDAHLKRGEFADAEDRFLKALELAPNDAVLHSALARAYAGSGKFARATDEAAAAKALDPAAVSDATLAEMALLNARWLLAQGRHEEAARAFGDAKRLQPALDLTRDMADMCEARADVALKESRFPAAEKDLAKALGFDPKRTRLRRKLAEAHEGMGNYDAAVAELEKIAAEGGDEGGAAVKEIARIHETFKGDSAKAVAYYRRYLDTKPKSADVKEIEKKVKKADRDRDQVAEVKRTLMRKPSSVPDQYNLGVLLQRQGRFREAIDAYRKAIELGPDNAHAHFNLAYSYDRLRMYEEAVAEYRKAIQLKPDYLKAYSNLAAIYKQKRWYGKAIVSFQKALEIDPNYAHAHLGLGSIYAEGVRDRQKAVYHYTQYLRLDPQGAFAPQVRAWLRGKT
ncbi:MAG: tetratricopeptide repeat protein [Chlamydiae bacterium]|nr:tetratricopeptide repeat protein [Chlamydiota bacterium]